MCFALSPNVLKPGTHDSHHDPESAEFAIGWCARQVYYEYQASLHRDVELERVPEIEDDHHFQSEHKNKK